MIHTEVQNLLIGQIESEETQKTNLETEEASAKHHKKHHKHHHKHGKKPENKTNVNVEAKKSEVPAALAQKAKIAPASKTLIATKGPSDAIFDKNSQNVDVPIDETRAVTLKVSPTYVNDVVESVTLKSFRKVVGYDTFNSILKGDRNEKKDISDYYNITVSMMVKRIPEETAAPPLRDPYDGTKTLS